MNIETTSRLLWITLLTSMTSAWVRADPPAWWSDGNPPAWNQNAEPNNKGPASIGQAKWMASEALRALQVVDPTLAATIRNDLTLPQPNPAGGSYPSILDFSVPNPKSPEWIESQKAPLLIGQLKAIVSPFYARLNAVSPSYSTWLSAERTTNGTNIPGSIFPWTTTTDDDTNKAIATIGQLKAVFSLRFESLPPAFVDSDNDGLADDWEISVFGNLGVDPNGDADGDGLTNAQEFSLGTSPIDIDSDHDGIPDGEDSEPMTPAVPVAPMISSILVLTPLQ